jgi:adenine-specific DNA-methyltransferase
MAGAVGKRQTARGYAKWFIPKDSPFAILIQEDHFRKFEQVVRARDDVCLIAIVTDSVEAFREMATQLPGRRCIQLYRSYIDNFKINLEHTS